MIIISNFVTSNLRQPNGVQNTYRIQNLMYERLVKSEKDDNEQTTYKTKVVYLPRLFSKQHAILHLDCITAHNFSST